MKPRKPLFNIFPLLKLTKDEAQRRVFFHKLFLGVQFVTVFIVFSFYVSSQMGSFAISVGIVLAPVLFFVSMNIFRRYFEVEEYEIKNLAEVVVPLEQQDIIIRTPRPGGSQKEYLNSVQVPRKEFLSRAQEP